MDYFQTEFYRQVRATKGQVSLQDPPPPSVHPPVVPQADIRDVYNRSVKHLLEVCRLKFLSRPGCPWNRSLLEIKLVLVVISRIWF